MSNAKVTTRMISKSAGKVLLGVAMALPALPAVAGEAKAPQPVASSSTAKKPAGKPATGCNAPAAQAAAQKQFQEIQEVRIVEPRRAVGLVHAALANRCLDPKKIILVHIGLVAACGERMQQEVRYFFEKSNRDPALIQACPELLP